MTVRDWATDYDYFDAAFVADPHDVWADLRERCPLAHTDRHGGSWMPTTYDLIAEIAYDTDHFSSRDVGVVGAGENRPLLVAPPITSDPPFHTAARRLLLPAFAPKAIDALEPLTRGVARELLDAIGDAETADAAVDYAQHIPVRVIAHMLGVSAAMEATFTEWIIRVLPSGPTDPDVGIQASREMLQFFRQQVERRRDGGGERDDDLISFLLDARIDGEALTDKHIIGTCMLILVAGIDTTWSSIGSALWHLATHPDDRQRLVDEPSLIPTAVEELLRAYSPVTMARVVEEEIEIGDRRLWPGERVLLPFPAGNRDPAKFDDAAAVTIDRQHNRHFAFGIGIHRCLGSNLARLELRMAIEEWLSRFPDFRLGDGATVQWTGGQVRGPRSIPVTLR